MSDDNDDIENDFDSVDFDTDGFDDGGFDDFNDQKGTLGDLWRNNPLVKVGVILFAIAFLIGGVILFGGKKDNLPVSRVASKEDLKEAPGSEQISETYRLAVEEEDVRRTEKAIRESESAIPTPVDPPKGTLPLQFEEPEEEDPLERWRRMQEERIRQQQVETREPNLQEPETPPVDTRTPAINALAAAMSQQMESVLTNQPIRGPIVQPVATVAYLEALQEKERRQLEEALAAQQAQQELLTGNTAIDDLNIILPAGTIEYAQMLTEANTDAPGPILAQIVTGPLKGARVVGTFTSSYNYLTLSFNTVILDGVDFSANGVAIDPNTTLPGVVTEIDRRYFKRVILPASAAFVTGLTEAISNSGRTTIEIRNSDGSSSTTTQGTSGNDQEIASGIEELGEELEDILDEVADNTEPMLRVASGTPIGILFVDPVIATPKLIQQQQLNQPSSGVTLPLNEGQNLLQNTNNLLPNQ